MSWLLDVGVFSSFYLFYSLLTTILVFSFKRDRSQAFCKSREPCNGIIGIFGCSLRNLSSAAVSVADVRVHQRSHGPSSKVA